MEKKNDLKLGFGLMRLPKLEDGSIDIEQTKTMADMFIEAGGTYFDTAFVYDRGGSEEAFRKAVVERYPRESYTIATKLNVRVCPDDEAAAKQEFFTSLERIGAGYFDYYLLHAVQRDNLHIYDKFGIWDFVKEQKAKGLIKHWGFSYHADPELLEKILTDHPDAEFVQLQINYADWENPTVWSRENYEVVRKHGLPVVIMEPVKGGSLVKLPEKAQEIFREADPDASFASWAIRFAASLDGILTVLSGMSNTEQMADNLSFMRNFRPLDENDLELIEKVRKIIGTDLTIPCTACHYCTDGCPMQIPIPEIFELANSNILAHDTPRAKRGYQLVTEGKGKASDCVECGQCELACPQHLGVIRYLKQCLDMEKPLKF